LFCKEKKNLHKKSEWR